MLQLKDCYNEDGFKYITNLWRKKTVRIRDEKGHSFFFLCLINSVKQINRAGTVPASKKYGN